MSRRNDKARAERPDCPPASVVKRQFDGEPRTAIGELFQYGAIIHDVPIIIVGLSRSGTTALMGNTDSRELIQAIMQEVVDAATALGHRMPDNFAAKLLASTDRMPDYLPSMHHDFVQKRPLELAAIYEAPLAAAAAAGFEMPRIRALYQALRFIDARNQG